MCPQVTCKTTKTPSGFKCQPRSTGWLVGQLTFRTMPQVFTLTVWKLPQALTSLTVFYSCSYGLPELMLVMATANDIRNQQQLPVGRQKHSYLHSTSIIRMRQCVTAISVQFSSVHFDLITLECCISNTEEVFMQVLGPISGGWWWRHHWTHLNYCKWHCSNLFFWKGKGQIPFFKVHHPSTGSQRL